MQNTRFILSLCTLIGLLCTSLVQACPSISSDGTTAIRTGMQQPQKQARLSFVEKIALRRATRKLQKALERYGPLTDQVSGDSTRPCGRVVLLSGERIEAELAELTATEVKYRRCGHPEDPLLIRSRREVLAVIASNGDELYSNLSSAHDADNAKTDGFAIASLVLGLTSFAGIGSVLAIIFGLISLDRISRHPDKYKGKAMAIAGIVLGLLVVALLLAIVISFA